VRARAIAAGNERLRSCQAYSRREKSGRTSQPFLI
jgi:hypothetical protein